MCPCFEQYYGTLSWPYKCHDIYLREIKLLYTVCRLVIICYHNKLTYLEIVSENVDMSWHCQMVKKCSLQFLCLICFDISTWHFIYNVRFVTWYVCKNPYEQCTCKRINQNRTGSWNHICNWSKCTCTHMLSEWFVHSHDAEWVGSLSSPVSQLLGNKRWQDSRASSYISIATGTLIWKYYIFQMFLFC
jgi:hypothetical protein